MVEIRLMEIYSPNRRWTKGVLLELGLVLPPRVVLHDFISPVA